MKGYVEAYVKAHIPAGVIDAVGNIGSFISSLFTNLVALYDFENSGTTLNDLSGNSLNGTNYISVTPVAGNPSNAYTYSFATNQNTIVADDTLLDFTGAFTISSWVNMASLGSSRALITKDNGTNREFAIWIMNTGEVRFLAYENGGSTVVTAGTPTGVITTAANKFIQVKMDASKRVRTGLEIWVNGVQQSLTYSGTITDLTVGIAKTSATILIGKDTPGALYFNGTISQLGIWAKKLTTTEDAYLYNSGSGRNLADW